MQEAHLLTIKSASPCLCSQKALCHKAVLGWAELAGTTPGVPRESHRQGMGTGDEEPHMQLDLARAEHALFGGGVASITLV